MDVINTVFKRNYISNINAPRLEETTDQQPRQTGALGIVATELGLEIIQSMRSYVPEIISSDFTRFTEAQLYQIESGTMRSANVLKSAIDRLNEALVYLKKQEKEIGHHLTEAITMTRLQQQQRQHQQTTLGACPVCRDRLLRIIRSSRTKKSFIGCSNYTSGKCKAAAALPQIGSLLSTGKKCSVCKWPILIAAHLGPDDLREFCINDRCPKKKVR